MRLALTLVSQSVLLAALLLSPLASVPGASFRLTSPASTARPLAEPPCANDIIGNQPFCVDPQMVYDPVDGYVVVYLLCLYGLLTFDSCTWKYQGGTWTNISGPAAAEPPTLDGDSFVWDAKDGYALLYGGLISPGVTRFTGEWAFSGGVWSNLSTTAPTPYRFGVQTAAYDSTSGSVLTLWQTTLLSSPNDTTAWTESGGTWTNVTATLPAELAQSRAGQLVDDPSDGGLAMIQTCEEGAPSVGCDGPSATWIYAHGTWTEANSTVAPWFSGTESVTWDSFNDYVLAIGGYLGACSLSQCYPQGWDWTFSHGTWTNITDSVSGDQPRENYGQMVSDLGDGYVLEAFGQVGPSDPSDPQGSAYAFSSLQWREVGSTSTTPTTSWWTSPWTFLGIAIIVVAIAAAIVLTRRGRGPRPPAPPPPIGLAPPPNG